MVDGVYRGKYLKKLIQAGIDIGDQTAYNLKRYLSISDVSWYKLVTQ